MFQSMDAIPLEELKTEVCPRISAEDLLTLSGLLGATNGRNTSERSRATKPRIIVIDVRSHDEYPWKRFWVAAALLFFHVAACCFQLILLGLCLGWYGHLMVLYKIKLNWVTWSPPKYVLPIILS